MTESTESVLNLHKDSLRECFFPLWCIRCWGTNVQDPCMHSLHVRTERKSFIARERSVFSLSFVSACLVLFVFVFFSLRI